MAQYLDGAENGATIVPLLCRYPMSDQQPETLWTNNGTKQIVGKLNMRSKSMRSYKSTGGMLAANTGFFMTG